MNTVKALGEHYFASAGCPIGVTLVSAAPAPQHEHDLTEIMHCHDFSELVIISSGKGVQVVNGVEYPVEAGDVFLLQGMSEHAFKGRENISLINVQFSMPILGFPLAFLRKIPGYNVMFQLEPILRTPRNFKHRLHLEQKELDIVACLADKMLAELKKKSIGFEASAFSLLIELIVFISRQYSEIHVDNNAALVRMGDVISRLETEFASEWTLAKIAAVAKTSPNNLLRLFKAATGESPIDYLISVRLRKASEILHSTDMRISEIAFHCGFHDSNYFTKRFTALYGKSPREYRDA